MNLTYVKEAKIVINLPPKQTGKYKSKGKSGRKTASLYIFKIYMQMLQVSCFPIYPLMSLLYRSVFY